MHINVSTQQLSIDSALLRKTAQLKRNICPGNRPVIGEQSQGNIAPVHLLLQRTRGARRPGATPAGKRRESSKKEQADDDTGTGCPGPDADHCAARTEASISIDAVTTPGKDERGTCPGAPARADERRGYPACHQPGRRVGNGASLHALSPLRLLTAYRILEESAASEDIVQEVFLSIWRKAASYQRQYGSVHSWLQAIVHNRAIDRVRSAAYREQQWKSLQRDEREEERGREGEQDPASEQPDVWEEAWQRERSLLIRQALASLPREQRQVIEESYFEGRTHFEIAQRCNLPLGTVKGRMRLGLQKMRRYLEEHGLDVDF